MSKVGKMKVVRRQADSDAEMPSETTRAAKVEAKLSSMEHGTRPIPDRVAESGVYYRNWEIPGAREEFPYHIELRFVDRMYPYAKPSALLVDMPQTAFDNLQCLKKGDFCKEMGIRYLILKPEMSYEEAMASLEGSDGVANSQG